MFQDASPPNSHPFSTRFDFHRIVSQPPHTEWCASYVGAACERGTALQGQKRWLATLVEWLEARRESGRELYLARGQVPEQHGPEGRSPTA